MSLDWTHQFCLACDKQTDGAAYCSESCRLADYEKTSTPSSGRGSPAIDSRPLAQWSFSNPRTSSQVMYLAPAYDFSNRRPYGSTPSQHTNAETAQHLAPVRRLLSPSNSHTSLCSMRSSSSDSNQLSENVTRELQAYARSFESVRLQRRRSY